MAGDVTTRKGYKVLSFSIALGEATSGVMDVGEYSSFAIRTPTALTHATMNFLAATTETGTTATVYDFNNVAVTLPVTINRTYALGSASTNPLSGVRYFKVQMGAAGTPATEAAARTFYLICKS